MNNLSNLLGASAERTPDRIALRQGTRAMTYAELWSATRAAAQGLRDLGAARGQRVAIFLDKRLETVVALQATAAAGAVFVIVNPVLREAQVGHILADCSVSVLVTTATRHSLLVAAGVLPPDCRVVLVDRVPADGPPAHAWADIVSASARGGLAPTLDTDVAALMYTSGSTGKPKGVVLSHRSLLEGAWSVNTYLRHTPDERILSLLPLSFDAGLNQVTTALAIGATTILLNYLRAQEVVAACEAERVTAITGVPPLWSQLAAADWTPGARAHLRYFANTGGHMPRPLLARLRALFPQAEPYLMYGLTEAFRSTYLDPSQVDLRPDSIGKAVPNAEIRVLDRDGNECAPGVPGELVHRGAFVALGYWNRPDLDALRFRPLPPVEGTGRQEHAVWSGDIVRRDEEGYLYFVGRNDDLIKTSGYRVSPWEVEDAALGLPAVQEAAAIGVPHETLGQSILLFVVPRPGEALTAAAVRQHCARVLPSYMVPHEVRPCDSLPRNPNGKIDRPLLVQREAEPTPSAA